MAVTANKPRPRSAWTLRDQPTQAGAVIVLVALACASTVHAVGWDFEPSVGGQATYTDNSNHSENDPHDALILTATPGFTLRSKGSRRVEAIMQYGLTGVQRFRFGEDDSTDILHRLNAMGTAELVEDFLFIDGSARISQEIISLEGSLVEAEISDSNRANVGTYSVSPYVRKRLGTFADALARYTASGAIFENDVAANQNVNAFTAGLTSGTRFDELSWGVDYSIREARNRNDVNTTFERAGATLGYKLTPRFRIFGTAGEEWNDYPSVSETDGTSWSAGFGWSPGRRTSIEASMGERFFGNTYSLSARHRTRASNWNVRYVEDLSDLSLSLFTTGTVYDYLCTDPLRIYVNWPFGVSPAPDCQIIGFGEPGLLFDLRGGVFVSRSLAAGVSWGIGKLKYSLNAYDSKRDFQLADAEDRTQGVTAALGYRLAPNTHATGSVGLSRNTIPAALSTDGVERIDDISRFTLGVAHQFDPGLSGGLTYQHQQRDSNVMFGDFTENRITAMVNMSF
jgi:uncharacterized protein (PEP-CTERM system associated)